MDFATQQHNTTSSSTRHAAFCASLREWQPLLHALTDPLSSSSPVGAAIHWVRSYGYPCPLGTASRKRANVGSLSLRLWRLVPELLAFRVAVLIPDEALGNQEQAEVICVPADEEMDCRETKKRKRSAIGNCMWIQTLPSVAQVNILSFLSAEHSLFRSVDLELLGLDILSASDVEFWVARGAEDLLLKVSGSNKVLEEAEHKCSNSIMIDPLPDWIHQQRHSHRPVVPWLPLKASIRDSNTSKPRCDSGMDELSVDKNVCQTSVPLETNLEMLTEECEKKSDEDEVIDLKTPPCLAEGKGGRLEEDVPYPSSSSLPDGTKGIRLCDIQEKNVKLLEVESELNGANDMNVEPAEAGLRPDLYSRAQTLRNSWLEMRLSVEDVDLLRTTPDSSALLKVIRPWEMGDDVVLCIIEALMGREDGFSWSAQILSYCLLPKLICLEQPVSRVLISAVLQGSKLHPRAAVDALLVPLILSDGGPNTSQCDVINRTMKECLSDHHVASFCKKIVLQDRRQLLPFAIPPSVPPDILGRFLVWSDALCAVVQNILNRSISLDDDLLEGLVNILEEAVDKLTKSLKFSTLLLCFISNYGPFLKQHKNKLQRIAEKTNTFMTKSILARSSAL